MRERDDQPDLTLSLVWDSGEVEQRPAEEVIDIAAGKVAYPYPRSALIRFTGQDHSWVWQPGPLDVAGTPSVGQRLAYVGRGVAYVVHASMANHSANFRAANEFLSVSAIDGGHLARSTHLLEGYLSRWMEASGTNGRTEAPPYVQ